MTWRNIRLILSREIRDQLRDRRTLFMIFVLPVLMYPLLGMSMFQVIQFMKEEATRVLVSGVEALPESPKLIENDKFASQWFGEVDKADLLHVIVDNQMTVDKAKEMVGQGTFEAVVIVPNDFADRLGAFRKRLKQGQVPASGDKKDTADAASGVPSPEIIYSTAKEKSQLAYLRVSRVLQNWNEEIVRENLAQRDVPVSAMRPFAVTEHDVAETSQRNAAVWSKILPFLLLIWALTGAFYPAIDLCAGEKERGTLETLLSSPAQRGEIVWGKLLTIMVFSIATALLNIASIGFTGAAVSSHIPEIGPPPVGATLWLTVALIPMSAMFSALCLALAAFAKSTKEGQYYLMPLVLITLPLVVLPLAPGVELNLGNSLIPVTGVMLLLRSMLEGEYVKALPFVLPVIAVTTLCCHLAIRWATEQFNSESVLFRESERFDFGLWVRHMFRDREETPSLAAGVACGMLILVLRFFMSFAQPAPGDFNDVMRSAIAGLLAVVLTPALLMTLFMTRSPVQTLLLRRPNWLTLPAVVVLAVALHPLVIKASHVVRALYPIDPKLTESLEKIISQAPNLTLLILVLALTPAICEELAYRGFILSGLRRQGNKWRAILVTSILFGAAHGFVQQSIMATITGTV
ncbi:MAG: CPBP family intramembrane metalloprotease, partial [Planctomycetaceae bacterium]|nr:CPBP family intramembrane metalloprotease [Planctomycetaceae bacterium]